MSRPPTPSSTDQQLVARVLRGEHAAFTEIVRRTEGLVAQLVFKMIRQRIHAQLNKGEELHALRAWLWFGSEGVIGRKQQVAQSEAARCLTLLTNCVLLWNTVYMQEVLEPVMRYCVETRF